MNAIREATLECRYRAIQAYGNKVQSALPNAREVGLVAYVPIQRTHDAKVARCAKLLRAIEVILSEG